MYLQDHIDTADVIATAFASPKLNPRKPHTIEEALTVVNATTTKAFTEGLAKSINLAVLDAVAMYEINNGEYADIAEGDEGSHERSEYESGLDDAVEAALEEYEANLSADWLGKNTIDTELWLSTDDDRTRIDKFALSAAKEVFKQLTLDKTPSQILASAGITRDLVQEALDAHTGEKPMADTDIGAVIAKVSAHVGKGFDQVAVYEDIETIIEDDDDILTQSAASRIGLDEGDVTALQIAAMAMDDAPSDILELVAAHKEPSGRATTAAAKKEKATAAAEVAEGATDPIVLDNLKSCGAGDTAMAEALGVSRSTYTNYIKGKTPFSPDGDQYALVRDEIVKRANLLAEALAALDGTDVVEVA